MAGPYGPQTGGSPSPGPYGDQRKGKAVGPYAGGHGNRVQRMRDTLRKNGYDVDASGVMTKRMLTAWHAYRVGIHPNKWNAAHAQGRTPGLSAQDVQSTRDAIASGSQDRGAGRSHAGGGGLDDLPGKAAKVTKVQAKAAVHAKALTGSSKGKVGGANIPGVKVGNPNVNKLIPTAMAGKLAGLQFDPQIREALLQQVTGKRDTAQAQADIGNWFGQAEASQGVARQRDTAAADSARSSVSNELNGIIQSLGGSRGAGVVGAQGAADLTALAGQGQAQEQYNNDLAPIIKGQEAGQHARQQALASQAAEKLGAQLIDLRGQRGGAEAQALMSIMQGNNAARQANFGNRASIESQNLAAQTLGLNTAYKESQAANANRRTNLYAKSVNSKLTSKGTPSWAALSAGDKLTAVQKSLSGYLDPTSGALLPGADPNDVLNKARQTLRGLGFSSARKIGYKGPGVNARAQHDILGLLHSQLAAAMSPQRRALPQTGQ